MAGILHYHVAMFEPGLDVYKRQELHDEPDGVYLISLNQKYRPIQVLESDSFKIFRKVIGKCKGAAIPGFH